MLFGQIPTRYLKYVASRLWNAPVPCETPPFHFVEIVGTIKDFHVLSVRFVLTVNSDFRLILF